MRTLTLEQDFALPASDSIQELDEGELIEMPGPRVLHALVQGRLAGELIDAVDRANQGLVFSPRGQTVDRDAPLEGAPDLAIEILSPTDRADDIRRKTRQYPEAGGREVWIVYTNTREIDVFTVSGVRTVTGALETPLIPGFRSRIERAFPLIAVRLQGIRCAFRSGTGAPGPYNRRICAPFSVCSPPARLRRGPRLRST